MQEIDVRVTTGVSDGEAQMQDGDICEVIYVDAERVHDVRAQLPSHEMIQEVAAIFNVLSDPTRAKIIFALSRAELCVCDLASLLDVSLSAVSHQLRLLRSLGLVRYRKEGRLAYYALTDSHVEHLLHDVVGHVQTDHAVRALHDGAVRPMDEHSAQKDVAGVVP